MDREREAVQECREWREAVVKIRDMAIEAKVEEIEDFCLVVLLARIFYDG